MDKPLLAIQNVEAYYGPVLAIRGVSLKVEAGSIVALLGSNGAGKTTILKAISGVVEPQKGSIEFDGDEIQGCEPDKVVRRGILHVPEGREVFPFLSVQENLLMGAYLRWDRDAVRRDIDRMFDYFPVLRERREQPAQRLSGGEQQMLAISRALMARPRLLLLDEPSLGLSPLLMSEIFTIIQRVNRDEGMTILLVEQNARMAFEVSDYGYVLEVGRIVLEGACADLMRKEDIREFYLGVKDKSVRGGRRWKRKKLWR